MITFQTKTGMGLTANLVYLCMGLKHKAAFLDGAAFESAQVVGTVQDYLHPNFDAEVIIVENWDRLNQNARDELVKVGLHKIVIRVNKEDK